MQSAPKDILKDYVQSQQFTSTADIMQAMKEMFRDVIEQVMEVEMDDELGRERCQRAEEPGGTPRNYRNGYSLTDEICLPNESTVDSSHRRTAPESFPPSLLRSDHIFR